jgi:hypothetical protein
MCARYETMGFPHLAHWYWWRPMSGSRRSVRDTVILGFAPPDLRMTVPAGVRCGKAASQLTQWMGQLVAAHFGGRHRDRRQHDGRDACHQKNRLY